MKETMIYELFVMETPNERHLRYGEINSVTSQRHRVKKYGFKLLSELWMKEMQIEHTLVKLPFQDFPQNM